MTRDGREEAIDEGLLNAAAIALFLERCGLPLVPWQQRVVDGAMVAEQLGVPLTVRPPRRPPANT